MKFAAVKELAVNILATNSKKTFRGLKSMPGQVRVILKTHKRITPY